MEEFFAKEEEMGRSARYCATMAQVTRALKSMSSKSARLEEVKEQIRIRVLGFGWSDLHTAWSKDGEAFGEAHLLEHLKMIIKEQGKRTIPSCPPVPLLQRKALKQLGTETEDKKMLDARAAASSGAFEANALAEKRKREAAGVGDSNMECQPRVAPTVSASLVGKRLEVLCHYDLADSVLEERDGWMWCSCEVLSVTHVPKGPRSYYKDGEAAWVRWDPNDNVTPPEPATEGSVELKPPSKFNKEAGKDAWRFDLD